MTTTYRGSRRDQRIADEFLDGNMPCSICGAHTSRDDLSTLGARCRPCYELYCSGGRQWPRLTPQDRRAMADRVRAALMGAGSRPSGKQLIAAFQARVDAGETLSPGQRGFLEAARRNSGASSEAVAIPAAIPATVFPPAAGRVAAPVMAAGPESDDVPPWVLDDIPAEEAEA
jgi:hypothetical protein